MEKKKKKKSIKKCLQIVLPLFLGAFILYWTYRDFNFDRVWSVLAHDMRWGWMLFSLVFGQTVNLKMAVFDWENEVSIVKQSASAFVGGIVPFFVMMPLTMGVMAIPVQYINVCMLGFSFVLGIVTIVLYKKNSKVNLLNI